MTVAIESVLYRAPSVCGPARVVSATPARLVAPGVESDSWGLDDERGLGFFGDRPDADAFVRELEKSGLRGRGGAGFPAHRKWSTVRAAGGETVVVANGHEGEPASSKDRWLLTRRPHLVLDGLILAATVVGARDAIVYLSDVEVAAVVDRAIGEIGAAGLVPGGMSLRTHVAEHTYVAGEESAVCRSIDGGAAKPTSKPPRPYEAGVRGLPTLISNVETLAHAAWIRVHGADEFAAVGSDTSKGTALFTLTGAVGSPGVFEMSLGRPVHELVAAGAGPRVPHGLLMGGWFGGILQGDRAAVTCCYDALNALGSGLGCAAVTVLGEDDDVLAIAGELADWFRQESAAQCGVCVSATNAIARSIRQVSRGDDSAGHRANLSRWGTHITGRGACGFVDGAAALARSVGAELERRATSGEHDAREGAVQ
ncbi:NADH-ubiquinone oxidoreductase-F iron-sulfur binding region domain-containing protein [Rhodococcus sp. HNM0569]|uniref:NADH-ubiquinone oxidoreductase-F iron-sulfur binding region domain-containing protein n=1 Tax=Rhodococcus sp. HNM0569 TaxID=2716340 RepID=UPI00146E81D2|nr:NADH-ubiquinone oxidoreductase-F iron-sulfur binding region domain-containing protein [Rhodococcus sp. HNM0569]NLU82299.1 NADH dehydrogenase subunit F [Rhodococcus sp. HNM0569]